MVEQFQNCELAFGWDNQANLENIETWKIDSRYIVAPRDLGTWSDGLGSLNGESVDQPQGYPSFSWEFGHIPLLTWDYFHSRLGFKRSGKVTVRTRRYEPDYSVICNAVMHIGDTPTLNKIGNAYTPFVATFTRVEILEEDVPFGAIYCAEASTAQADITTTPVIVTGFAADGLYSGVTPSHSGNTLTALYAGTYRVDFHISATATASQQFIFHVRVNAVEGVYSCQFVSNALVARNASFTGYISLDVDDVVSVYVETDDPNAGTSLTPTDMQLSIQRIALS